MPSIDLESKQILAEFRGNVQSSVLGLVLIPAKLYVYDQCLAIRQQSLISHRRVDIYLYSEISNVAEAAPMGGLLPFFIDFELESDKATKSARVGFSLLTPAARAEAYSLICKLWNDARYKGLRGINVKHAVTAFNLGIVKGGDDLAKSMSTLQVASSPASGPGPRPAKVAASPGVPAADAPSAGGMPGEKTQRELGLAEERPSLLRRLTAVLDGDKAGVAPAEQTEGAMRASEERPSLMRRVTAVLEENVGETMVVLRAAQNVPLADSIPESNRFSTAALAVKIRACKPVMVNGELEVPIVEFEACMREVAKVFDLLGKALFFIKADITSKCDVMRKRTEQHPHRFSTVQGMIRAEMEDGVVKKMNSGTWGSTRLRWVLEFICVLVTHVTDTTKNISMEESARLAYNQALASHHPWLVRKTVTGLLPAVPSKEKFLQLLGSDENTERANLKVFTTDAPGIVSSLKTFHDKYNFDALKDIPL